MPRPDYEADEEKYGESDLRIRKAGRDPKKLSEAAKQHPDYKPPEIKQGIPQQFSFEDKLNFFKEQTDLLRNRGIKLGPPSPLFDDPKGTAMTAFGWLLTNPNDWNAIQYDLIDFTRSLAKTGGTDYVARKAMLNRVFDFRVPNILKLPGLFDVGTGINKGGIKYNRRSGPAPKPAWEGEPNLSRNQINWIPKEPRIPSRKGVPFKDYDAVDIKPLKFKKSIATQDLDRWKIITEYSDLPAVDQLNLRNEVVNFINQADTYRRKAIKYDKSVRSPLDGFEYTDLSGKNTGSRLFEGPDGQIWTLREKKGKYKLVTRQSLTDRRLVRHRRDTTSSMRNAAERRLIDRQKKLENKILTEKRNKLINKPRLSKLEKEWLRLNDDTGFYGEHIRQLGDRNPVWQTPQMMKGTMKRGDPANYVLLSNQTEKKFKDSIESIIYGNVYGATSSRTGNKLTVNLTKDLRTLTIEEILPDGNLRVISEIPFEKAYDLKETADLRNFLVEQLGPPPGVRTWNIKEPGKKTITRYEQNETKRLLNELFPDEGPFKDLTKTSERKYMRKKYMKGGGEIK